MPASVSRGLRSPCISIFTGPHPYEIRCFILLTQRNRRIPSPSQMKTPSILLSRAGPSSWVISLLFMISAAYFYGENVNALFRQSFYPGKTWSALAKGISNRTNEDVDLPFAVSSNRTKCDVFNGTWVRDEVSRPLYQESDCPYILTQLTCQKYGRPDKAYQNWRWQPHACSIQRFNATFMWEMLRNKRMMFVGDSLSHGQFISMVCLLHSAIPKKAKSMKQFDSLTVFRAENYNTTIEFYWAPFLLDSNADNTSIHRIKERIVRAGSIDKHSRHWKGVDILVFDTYIWWLTGYPMKIMRKSSEDKKVDIVLMEMDDAYRIAIKSLAKWVDNNVDPTRNRVFFTTMSPNHDKSQDWGRAPGGNCYNETSLIEDPTYWGSSSRKIIMGVIGEEFGKMMVPITLINITQLSEYRKDGHVSIYKKQYTPLTAEQLAKPASYSDCIHWCLPGVQDTWNELLYTKLFYP